MKTNSTAALPGLTRFRRTAAGLLRFALVGAATALAILLLARGMAPEEIRTTPSPEDAAAADDFVFLPPFDETVARLSLVNREAESRFAGSFTGTLSESPALAALVAENRLPDVADRVGDEPVIVEGVSGNGRYGGHVALTVQWVSQAFDDLNNYFGAATLVRWSPGGYPIVPHIARAWSHAPDFTSWTLELREGMRWSDGHPFTADDIYYWWRHEIHGRKPGVDDLAEGSSLLRVGAAFGSVEMVSPTRVRFVFPVPNPFFLESLASDNTKFAYSPRHYLEPYHPEVGDPEKIAEAMEHFGLPTPIAAYREIKREDNPWHPRLGPWVLEKETTYPPYSFVRNPYFCGIDTEGRQLPYIDRVSVEYKTYEVMLIDAAAGALPFVGNIRMSDYTLLAEEGPKQGYDVRRWHPTGGTSWSIHPNINRRDEPGDSASQWKKRLLDTAEFRHALSLAIDREAIIRGPFLGIGEPAQIAPPRHSPFFNEKLYKSFTTFDPDQANALLDGLGLTRRDSEGYRTFPDGSRMTFFIYYKDIIREEPFDFITDDWRRVGVRAVYKRVSDGYLSMLMHTGRADFTAWTSIWEWLPFIIPINFFPHEGGSTFAFSYSIWHSRLGYPADDGANSRIGRPPPIGHPVHKAVEYYNAAMTAPSRTEALDRFNRVLDHAAEQLWPINIASAAPNLALVREDFKNVPASALGGGIVRTPFNFGPETFYFEKPRPEWESPEEVAERIGALLPKYGSLPRGSAQIADTGGIPLLRGLIVAAALCFLAMIGVRHPYVGRRLLLFIPVMAVISLAVFIIVQIPPGNIIETRLLNLQDSGSAVDLQEIDRIKTTFHLDDPFFERYLKWIGLNWFLTFDKSDLGLLQGHLGASLDDPRRPQPVNKIVGDRILLTFCISLGTILFTWALALPIGVISAVKQYSIFDYVLTFIGFIGMCIPGFLLALLVLYWGSQALDTSLTGLFSPEYATQEEWTWGKFVDLLRHIWVPLLVLGVSGTASMIRVMRANLLDELKKPYVITARAKGMRPTGLIVKYPVRIALNPFISSIGHLFPQLISGGAIVAIVLGLPTVGPLLLDALMNEDIYLAASMLVVLSFLGVIGTLVSDLLLLWLDPRIRMEGESR